MNQIQKRLLSLILICAMLFPVSAYALEPSDYNNGDTVVRTDLFTTDMVHDNPGLEPYNETAYKDDEFLAARGFDGHVFFLNDAASFGLLWDAYDLSQGVTATDASGSDNSQKVYPYGSEARQWAENKKAELKAKYKSAKDNGLKVYFMMDMIALPSHLVKLYPEVTKNSSGSSIAVQNEKTKIVMDYMFAEMFTEFPEIDGIYIRYGENYVGSKYGSPYHQGNNPILTSGDTNQASEHIYLINYLRDKLCEGNYLTSENGAWEGNFGGLDASTARSRELVYRTWGFGSFQRNTSTYLNITNQITPHDNLYFAIKYTSGDFLRTNAFNQTLNIGKHKQIVEVQCSREYEGKGAYPNYIGNDVINGAKEYAFLNGSSNKKSLRDVVNVEDSLIQGIWTWSRGGGWNGPYITGVNGIKGQTSGDSKEVVVENGKELWNDLNAYVITQWAKDTSKTDKYYVLKYATEILGMADEDAEKFYQICLLSSDAVLCGLARTSTSYNAGSMVFRDNLVQANPFKIVANQGSQLLITDREKAVDIYEKILALANEITSGGEYLEYIRTTCQYGYYQFSVMCSMYQARYANTKNDIELLSHALNAYEANWNLWEQLYETTEGCPSLPFRSHSSAINMIGYSTVGGYDQGISDLFGKDYEWLYALKPGATKSLSGISFGSSNEAVATVDSDGTVKAVSKGVARIEVTPASGNPYAVLIEVNDSGKATEIVSAEMIASTIPENQIISSKVLIEAPAMPQGYEITEVVVEETSSSRTVCYTIQGKGTLSTDKATCTCTWNIINNDTALIAVNYVGGQSYSNLSNFVKDETAPDILKFSNAESGITLCIDNTGSLDSSDVLFEQKGNQLQLFMVGFLDGTYTVTINRDKYSSAAVKITIQDGKCSDSNLLYSYIGDCDGDGKSDEMDREMLIKNMYVKDQRYDLNGDGAINIFDWILMQYSINQQKK